MVCFQCGSPVEPDDQECPNCGAELARASRRIEVGNSTGARISQELKAITLDAHLFAPGEEVADRFRLGEMIGKGPFGEVYKATDSEIEAEVAVKVLEADVLSTPLDQERFLNATRAARALTQSNVVRIHDSGVHKDHPWISMQYLEGLSLRKVLNLRRQKNETFTLAELEPIVSQITLALQHVSREFPHGDLKPENIIFLPELLKVTDSYLLSALSDEVIAERLSDSLYLAPELHTPSNEPDARADVYSLGTIIGEMLFGSDYAPGSHADGEFAAVDSLCKRATAFDPSERYPSVEALSEDFATLVDTGSLLGSGPGSGPPSAPPPAPPGGAEVDPLLQETPMDIGEPLEEDIATVEYDRDEDSIEIQDILPTNEVERDQLPPPPVERSVTKTAVSAGPDKEEREGGVSMGLIGLLGLLVVGGIILIAGIGGDETSEKVVDLGEGKHAGRSDEVENKSDEGDEDETSPTELAAAADAGSEDAGLSAEAFAVGASAASDSLAKATVAALGVATKKGKELAEAEEEEEGERAGSTTSGTGSGSGAASASKSGDGGKPKASRTDCPKGMRLVKLKKRDNFCIDPFEFPGRGVKPKTRVNWFDAKRACNSRGKRLCTLREWRSACGRKYPYGRSWNADKCNTVDEDGFERSLAKTGSFRRCRSWPGAYDMVGNVHEWVQEQKIAGGGFESGEDVASCGYASAKAPGSSAGYIGFRCCANPQ